MNRTTAIVTNRAFVSTQAPDVHRVTLPCPPWEEPVEPVSEVDRAIKARAKSTYKISAKAIAKSLNVSVERVRYVLRNRDISE